MTTTVRIDAHLASDKEVRVLITEGAKTAEEFTLQDGQSAERYIYDNREITVKEVFKGIA